MRSTTRCSETTHDDVRGAIECIVRCRLTARRRRRDPAGLRAGHRRRRHAGHAVAVDRRPTGAQVDDGAIEFKVESEAGTRWGNEVHLNVTSYNANVLLT